MNTLTRQASRLVYLANARLPTEKAHGHAIVKMCEAYAGLGLHVELWHSHRRQAESIDRATTVFEYYGVPETFTVRTLPNLDVIPAGAWLPERIFPSVVAAHDVLWTAYAAARARALHGRAALYHTRDLIAAFWLTTAGLPTVLEVHTPPGGPGRALIGRVGRHPCLRGIVALTHGCRDDLVTLGAPPDKIVVLGSAVDTRPYGALPSPRESRRQLGLPADAPIAGYVGRFQTLGMGKGIDLLIDAFALLRCTHRLGAVLVCVGGPMDVVAQYLDAAAAAGLPSDALRFVDHVGAAEVPTWINACDVGVIPFPPTRHFARYASPLKAFEFMAAGVPVVASDLPAIREALSHGSNALLVEPESPGALAEAIARLLEDRALRTRLGLQAERDVAHHTWGHRAETIVSHFAG
jgi:glycosyltransferase involved in cell wall biosynthesis